MARMRSKTLFILVGITFVVFSYTIFMFNSNAMYRSIEEPAVYNGSFFDCSWTKYIRIEGRDNRSFSVYLLDYENGMIAFIKQSLENVSILETHQNVTFFEGVINGQYGQWFSILVSPTNSTSDFRYYITIVTVVPDPGMFGFGVVLCLLGFIGIGLEYHRTFST